MVSRRAGCARTSPTSTVSPGVSSNSWRLNSASPSARLCRSTVGGASSRSSKRPAASVTIGSPVASPYIEVDSRWPAIGCPAGSTSRPRRPAWRSKCGASNASVEPGNTPVMFGTQPGSVTAQSTPWAGVRSSRQRPSAPVVVVSADHCAGHGTGSPTPCATNASRSKSSSTSSPWNSTIPSTATVLNMVTVTVAPAIGWPSLSVTSPLALVQGTTGTRISGRRGPSTRTSAIGSSTMSRSQPPSPTPSSLQTMAPMT